MRRNLAKVFGVMVVGSLLLGGCAGVREYVVLGTQKAPDADAAVRIEEQDGGNFLVTLTVQHLLPPDRLAPELDTYAVWFQAAGSTPLRVGNLTYDADDRCGEVVATTTLTSFDIIISGEAGATAAAPSEHEVFRTSVESPQ